MIILSEPSVKAVRRVRTVGARGGAAAVQRHARTLAGKLRYGRSALHTKTSRQVGGASLVQIGYKPCHPTLANSPDVPAGHRTSRPPMPWPAFSQRRDIGKRTAIPQAKHALAGQTDLRDRRHQRQGRHGSGVGCGIPSTPQGLPRAAPGASPSKLGRWLGGMSPRCHTAPACKICDPTAP